MGRAQSKTLVMVALVGAGALSGCGASLKIASPYSRLNGAFSHALAVAHADAINLRSADLPGISMQRSVGRRLESLHRRYAACGRGTPRQTRSSPVFIDAHGYRLVSGVTISSAAVSLRDAAAMATRQFACDDRVVRALYRGSTIRVRSIVVSQLTAPVMGLKGGFGLRRTTAVNDKGAEMRVYDDRLGFVSGRTEVVLSVFASSVAPVASVERRVALLLYQRATEAARR